MVALASLASLLVPIGRPVVGQDSEVEASARRVIAMSALAAKEYAEGVAHGVIISSDEVGEAHLFLVEARRAAAVLPAEVADRVRSELDTLLQIVAEIGSSADVALGAERLATGLREALGGLPEPIPSLRPSNAAGRILFAQNCTECHGDAGAGDGFRAARLDPPPADLTDAGLMADQSPLDHFRKIRFGVSGTDMPAFEEDLSDEQIWAVVWYVVGLRGSERTVASGRDVIRRLCPACGLDEGQPARGLAALPGVLVDPVDAAVVTDEELAAAVFDLGTAGGARVDSSAALDAVSFLRTLPFAEPAAAGPEGTLASVRTELARAVRTARAGKSDDAAARVLDAYTAFEGVEAEIALRDQTLATRLEGDFADLRGRLAEEGEPAELAASYDGLLTDLETAGQLLRASQSRLRLFFQSFVLFLREGIEAILIVGALVTVVVRAGAPERRQEIWWGVAAAVGASVVTAVLLESVFRLGVAEQEILEGLTMLVATGVLVFVSYWLLAKVEVNHWKAFITSQVKRAISSGSMWTLGAAAFLAVYREGFETVLFYKALFITAEGQGAGVIGLGAAVGAVCLVGVYLAIAYAGLRIPLRAFFAATSAVLFYMAFTFAGKGIAELQESELLQTTLLEWAPRVPWMGIYPTVQSLAIQACLLALLVFGVLWTFVMRPNRAAARAS